MPGHKVCVILGAGASHGVRNLGTPNFRPELQPPLAKGLFDMEKNPHYFRDVMQPYPRAKVLTQIIAPTAATETATIETELARLAHHQDPQTKEDFKQIPPYLRDLLHKVSKDYTSLPGYYVQLAHHLLKDRECDVLFLVLNYDDLLEQALTYLYPSLKFTEMRHYVSNERPFKVVKLHGSINWFTKLSDFQTDNWTDLVSSLDIFAKVPEEDILIYDNMVKSSDWIGDDVNRYVYPLVTAPVASEAKAPVCPDRHYEAAKDFLSECGKFLVIGTAAMDQDLIDLIDSSVLPKTHPLLHVVDQIKKDVLGRPDEDSRAALTAQRLQNGIKAFYQGNLVEPATLFDEGFWNYVNSDEMQRFGLQ